MPPDSANHQTAIRKEGAKEEDTNHPAIALPMANAMKTDQNPHMANVVRIHLLAQDLKEEEDHPVIFQTENVRTHQEVQEKTNPDLKKEKGATEKDQPSVKEAVDHQEIFLMENVRIHQEVREKTNPDSRKEKGATEKDQPSVKEAVDHPVSFLMENVHIRQEDQEKTNPDLKKEKGETEKDQPSVKEAVDRQEIFQTENVRTRQEVREKTNPDLKNEKVEKEVTARYFVVEVARRNLLSIRNQDWVNRHPARQNDSVARKMPLREDRHPITTRNALPVLPIANHSANAEKKQKRARKAA
jgi:hypothetical protein